MLAHKGMIMLTTVVHRYILMCVICFWTKKVKLALQIKFIQSL